MTDQQPQSRDSAPIEQLDQVHSTLTALQSDADHVFRLATMGTLTAWLAHEVNNLLTPAMGYMQLAKRDPDDSELVMRAIDKAMAGIESATRISEALLGFSSTADDQTNRCNLHHVVYAALDCMPRDPAKDGISLRVNVPHDAEVAMAPHALQHVLLNLVLNACNALRGQEGQITISSIQHANGQMIITVSDSGPGIPKDIAGRIFEPFVSTGKSWRIASGNAQDTGPTQTNSGGGSTGLGLAVCRHLMEQAGGTITASSGPGTGATFTITVQAVRTPRAKAG
jgi:signal transduction histidine kinase